MLPSRAASTWVWKLSSSASAAGVISGLLKLARWAGVTVAQPTIAKQASTTPRDTNRTNTELGMRPTLPASRPTGQARGPGLWSLFFLA